MAASSLVQDGPLVAAGGGDDEDGEVEYVLVEVTNVPTDLAKTLQAAILAPPLPSPLPHASSQQMHLAIEDALGNRPRLVITPRDTKESDRGHVDRIVPPISSSVQTSPSWSLDGRQNTVMAGTPMVFRTTPNTDGISTRAAASTTATTTTTTTKGTRGAPDDAFPSTFVGCVSRSWQFSFTAPNVSFATAPKLSSTRT